jgi:hypothetical protein
MKTNATASKKKMIHIYIIALLNLSFIDMELFYRFNEKLQLQLLFCLSLITFLNIN